MSERQSVRVGDVARVVGGGTPKTGVPEYWDGGLPWATPKDLSRTPVKWFERGERDISPLGAERSSVRIVPQGTVLLTSRAPIGLVALAGQPVYTNQGFKSLVLDETQDPEYWYYLLRSSTDYLKARASGSTFKELNGRAVANLAFTVHPLDEQRRIAAVLSAFDELIETNQVLAARLHDAARLTGLMLLDKYAGKQHVPLREVATISKGFSYKSAELVVGADTLVNLKNFGRGGVFNRDGFKPLTSNRYKPHQVLEPSDVAISMTDLTQQREVIARPIRIPRAPVEGKMVASLDLAIARPRGRHSREFVAAVLSQEAFHSFARNYCNGTTVLHMSVKAFDDYTVPDISPDEAAPFVDRIRVLNEAEDSCRDEIIELTRTRDELLPLLMSGRVRVEDVEGVA